MLNNSLKLILGVSGFALLMPPYHPGVALQYGDVLLAQNPNPTVDRFPNSTQEPPRPLPEEKQILDIQTPSKPQLPTEEGQTVLIDRINVTGSTVFSDEEFQAVVEPYEGQELSIIEIRAVTDAITQLYLNQGYISSRARPVGGRIENNTLEIRIIEGEIRDVQIDGTKHLNKSYIRSRVKLGTATPLNTAKIEDQLRLLRANPLFDLVEAS